MSGFDDLKMKKALIIKTCHCERSAAIASHASTVMQSEEIATSFLLAMTNLLNQCNQS